MELQLSDDQELLRQTTQRFLADTCPLTEVRRLADRPGGFEPGWWAQGAELGWTSMLVPEAFGGGSVSGEGLADLALVAEEMGRTVAPGPLVPVNVVAAALGSSPRAAEFGPVIDALMAGTATAAWCAGRGADPLSGSVRAEREGGGFVLSGSVAPVEAGAEAAHLLVGALTDEGPAQFLVPGDAPGVTVTPRGGLDLVRRFATVDLARVAVDGGAVVTGPGVSGPALDRQFQLACVLQLSETMGAIDRVLEFTVEWAFDRYSFGRPLASYQALKHRFADMRLWLEASMATTTAAVRAVGAGSSTAGELVSVAKAYVGAHAPELVQDCVQMHGGIGVTWDHDIHLYLRRVTVNAEIYGTVAEHRRRLAALDGLGGHNGADPGTGSSDGSSR